MKTVHLIFHAHLDPIWLWPWTAGLDEALNTCRSACDRLDAHPDLRYSQGEAWVYQQIEQLDPQLFDRIRGHVAAGRWEIAGGWWIQPDCNAPSGFAMDRQIDLGKRYFLDRFGQFPRVGFNPDSFGHAATLPAMMRSAGQDCYVMMRPQEHEMKTPARVFRWRGYEGSPEVTTFRIATSYLCIKPDSQRQHILDSLTELPEGLDHTMCFLGLGDHGGGPTEKQIAWLRQNWNSFEGCRLEFSTMARYFDAIGPQLHRLPLVTGELQMHAVGCYSVYRPIKLGVRRAEHLVHQADLALPAAAPAQDRQRLQDAWETVCFHQFHDTMGGTCLPSAYAQVHEQLGFASSVADQLLQYDLRRKMVKLPSDPLQRMVFANYSDSPFAGYVEVEPWMDFWLRWEPGHQLLDENGADVPYQLMQPESLIGGNEDSRLTRVLLHLEIPARGLRVLRISPHGKRAQIPAALQIAENDFRLSSSAGALCTPDGPMMQIDGAGLSGINLELLEDGSDTWSHGIDRFAGKVVSLPQWEDAPVFADRGPLMAAMIRRGMIGQSPIQAEWRTYAGGNFVELLLQVHWLERDKVLKLTLNLPDPHPARTDGICGGAVVRPNDGRELPLRDWSLLTCRTANFGVVCPEVYAADVTASQIRLTLLRSPLMAHHVPFVARHEDPRTARAVVADQGMQHFRFRFFYSPQLTTQHLEQHALMLQRPPFFADYTRGMPWDNRGVE